MKKLFYIFLCVLFIPVFAYAGWRTLSDGTLKPTGTNTNVEIDGFVSATGTDTSAPAAVTSFTGTISAATKTATFTETFDYEKCKVGSTLIADGDTRIVVALLGSDQVTVDATTAWGGSTAITSLQEPIAQMKLADGTVVGYINALGGINLLSGVGSLQKGIVFNDGDSGFYESVDDTIRIYINGSGLFQFTSAGLLDLSGGSFFISSSAASATVPIFSYNGDDGSGVGRAAANQPNIIANSIEAERWVNTAGVITIKIPTLSVADEGTITFPTGISGRGWAIAGDNEEMIVFSFTTAGVVTLLADCTTNTANTDSDTDLCCYDGGTGIIIKNRLGATKNIKYKVFY